MSKIIAVTMGDPAGISPEIIIKALAEGDLNGAPAVVVGCAATLSRVLALNITPQVEQRVRDSVKEAHFATGIVNVSDEPLADPDSLKPGVMQKQACDLAWRCVKRATELALTGKIQAIATALLNKEALHSAGHLYPGHPELLTHLTDTKDIALRKFLDTLNQTRIKTVIGIADTFLRRVGFEKARIAVAGVNPHAGENGLYCILRQSQYHYCRSAVYSHFR